MQLIGSQPVCVNRMGEGELGESILDSMRKQDKKRKGSTRQKVCLTFTPASLYIAMKKVSLRF